MPGGRGSITVGNGVVKHRHFVVNLATGAGVAAGVAACVASVVCGVGAGAGIAVGGVVGGAFAHKTADALAPSDDRDMSIPSAIAQSTGASVKGAFCGITIGQGCLGMVTEGHVMGAIQLAFWGMVFSQMLDDFLNDLVVYW